MKLMGMVDDFLWWGVWGLRVALAAAILSIVFGLCDGYALFQAHL